MEEIHDSKARVMRSPRLAAIGVATLSGLMLSFLDARITATMTSPRLKEATEAVTRLEAQRRMRLKSSWRLMPNTRKKGRLRQELKGRRVRRRLKKVGA